jgi:hypothetical protein
MSVYNSIASMKNESGLILTFGAISLAPSQEVKFWDTTMSDVNSATDSLFISLKIAKDLFLSHVESGNISITKDGVIVAYADFVTMFDEMITVFANIHSAGLVVANGIKLNENKDPRGNIIFVKEERIGTESDIATHNFCDKTTWFYESTYVSFQTATDTGDGLSFKLPNEFIIDLTHGKVFQEDAVRDSIAHGYNLTVLVDGYEKKQFSIFDNYEQDGYDYFMDYRTGTITFLENQSGKTVLASYAYANGSGWRLAPESGKVINIEESEVQFSKNLVFNDGIVFEYWAYNPADLPNKVCVLKETYKSIYNFIDEARGCYPTIPAIGGADYGTKTETIGFPFNYNVVRQMKSSEGFEVIIRTKNGRELGGDKATATFYCTIKSE